MSEQPQFPTEPSAPQPNPQPQTVRLATSKPIITYVLLGLNVAIFLAQFLSEQFLGYDIFFLFGAKIQAAILIGQFWRLISAAFLHGSIIHLGFNMYALLVLGRQIESIYGHRRFLLLYLLAAFGGNVLSFVLTPANSVGSSTAIFGLLAAELAFILQNKRLFGAQTRPMLMNLFMILGVNLVLGLGAASRIDNFGHLGGLLAGFIFASLAGPKLEVGREDGAIQVADARSNREIIFAAVLVLVGFILIAAIPFISPK